MQDKKTKASYNPYSKQRLFRILVDMIDGNADANWSSLAKDIHLHRGVHFQRNNFYRLKDGTLSDSNVEIIVRWFEEAHDKKVRERLKPQAIFDEVGRSSRDYYFHIPISNDVDEWQEQILEEYGGVYFCCPLEDMNSYLPIAYVREYLKDYKRFPNCDPTTRSTQLPQYIQQRSILVLQPTPYGYFYATDFPFARILTKEGLGRFSPMDTYEGVAYVSGNTIQVQLRECMSRVVKTHGMLIRNKYETERTERHGLSIFVPPTLAKEKLEWNRLTSSLINDFRKESELSINSPTVIYGPSQISLCPITDLKQKATEFFARDHVFIPKPSDVLQKLDEHFISPAQCDLDKIQKIIDNPLSIGEFK